MLTQSFPDLGFHAVGKFGERAKGDCFLSKRDREENSLIAVLSDGLGSGIKANVLATLTAKIAINLFQSEENLERSAQLIYRTLPICSVRKISYATFTVVRVKPDGETIVIEYDNPSALIIRNSELLDIEAEELAVPRENGPVLIIRRRRFFSEPGDRVVFFSDGVTQAGMGSPRRPLGWQHILPFITGLIHHEEEISADKLSHAVLRQAINFDDGRARDDISCGVLHIRRPRRIMLVSGPPYHTEMDHRLARQLASFPGVKVICGGTTAQIIARELERQLLVSVPEINTSLPPAAEIDGIDLVTEGILTLSALKDCLRQKFDEVPAVDEPLRRLAMLLLDSDDINIFGGTRINEAHQDPSLPVELEIRRNILRDLAEILETEYLKKVTLQFV